MEERVGPIAPLVVIILAAILGFGTFHIEGEDAREAISQADRDLATPIPNLTFRFNETAYDLVYTPSGDVDRVTISPMAYEEGFVSGYWVLRPGLAVDDPAGPVRFTGRQGDGYYRFEIGAARGSALDLRYFDLPVTDRDFERAAAW
jgi:hypothetical protein